MKITDTPRARPSPTAQSSEPSTSSRSAPQAGSQALQPRAQHLTCGPGTMPPRSSVGSLPAPSAGEQVGPPGPALRGDRAISKEALRKVDLQLAGYLHVRASAARRIDDPPTIDRLRQGQTALARGIASLALGRGNVAADIAANDGASYVAVQLQRDAVEFLTRGLTYTRPANAGKPSLLAQRMMRLHACWPKQFDAELKAHFPNKHAADEATQYIAKTVAARAFASGNCGEHARVAADSLMQDGPSPSAVRIARSVGIDHAWAEGRVDSKELRDDDVILDGWMRTPVHLREDSHLANAATETRSEFVGAETQAWLAQVVAHMAQQVARDPVLYEITERADALAQENFDRRGAPGAESSVPLNLHLDLLQDASTRSATQAGIHADIEASGTAISMGLSIKEATQPEVVDAMKGARDSLLAQEWPTSQDWKPTPLSPPT